MIDPLYFQSHYEDLFWVNKPKSLHKENLISETNCIGFKIKFYQGVYIKNAKHITCEIRVVSENCGSLKDLVEREMDILSSLTKDPNIVKCFGFYFNSQRSKYILVTKRYPYRLNDIFHIGNQEKIQILMEIITGMLSIKNNSISYHGNISPRSIYITKNKRVKIGEFLNSGQIHRFIEDFCMLKETIDVIDVEYMSPELRLQYNCILSGLTLKPFDCCKSDCYSIGLIFLYMVTGQTYEINDLGVECQLCNEIAVNKTRNFIDCNISSHLIHTFQKNTMALERRVNNIQNQFIDTDNLFFNILDMLLVVYYDQRATLKDVLDMISIRLKQPILLDIKMINDSTSQGNVLTNDELSLIIREFVKFTYQILKKKVFDFNVKTSLNSEVERNLKKFEDKYSKAYSSFFDSNIYEQSKIRDGIAVFFRSLFITLGKDKYLESFHETITSLWNRTNYYSFFEKLMESDEIISDYILTGLELFTITKDWEYFFESSKLIPIENYTPLSNYPNLINEFNDIISCPVFASQLETFNASTNPVQSIFNERLISRIFFLKMQPSLCRLTTYSLRIFISSFKTHCEDLNSPKVTIRGAIFIILLHEMAHYLRRLLCSTRRDVKKAFTSKKENSIESSYDMMPEALQIRGEAGFDFEKRVFGGRVNFINERAAEYFINYKEQDINAFKKKFKRLNQLSRDSVALCKGSDHFVGIKCGMMYMPIDDI